MSKLHLLFLFSGLLYFSCTSKPKTQEKTDLKTIMTDTLRPESDNQEKEIIKKVSTSFYDWYLKRTNSLTDTVPYDYIFVKGDNGKCKVDFERYFTQLRQLKTVSEKFMNREVARAKDCVKHMETVGWIEYQNADAYEYEDYCPDCSYIYWIKSQEPYSGVEILNMEKKTIFGIRLYSFSTTLMVRFLVTTIFTQLLKSRKKTESG